MQYLLLNNTADCFNNIVFILVAKISSEKVCEKMKNNSILDKVLLVCNRNVELLRLVSLVLVEPGQYRDCVHMWHHNGPLIVLY